MQSIEVTAKSLDEAKKAASDKLGVPIQEIETTVLEETKGLFGKTTLRVKATVIESAAPPAPVTKAAPTKSEPSKPPAADPVAVEGETIAETAAESESAAAPSRAGGRRPRGGKTPRPASTETEPASEEAAGAESGPKEETGPEVFATEEDAEKLAALLREIVGSADLNVTVTPSGISGRYVNLVLDGKDVAFLVGKQGEVLNALQYLVNIIGNRKLTAGVRANLDGNDYRKRREDTLTQLAVNIASQVKKRGEEAVLDALPAFERRIVHKALSTVEGISTYSEGEEPNRRVIIAPAV
jgi:spoIIIJ-associated protein